MTTREHRRIARLVKNAVKQNRVELARSGGKAGRGESKRRGGSEYYSALARKRWGPK